MKREVATGAVVGLLLLGGLQTLRAQAAGSAQAEAQLSPQAAYDRAVRPLEIIRRSPQNWSEVELAALKTAREEAKPACTSRDADQLSGKDLIALAHLCAFAQVWQGVDHAASNYLAAARGSTPEPGSKAMTDLATAFDYKVQGTLNLDKPDEGLLAAQTMLRTVAYDEFASEATNTTFHYLRFIRTNDALALLVQRQPQILQLIQAYGVNADAPAPSASGPTAVAHPSLPLYVLYTDAIDLPMLEQFANKPGDAAKSYADLEAALPQRYSSEDGMFMEERRRQYLLLGTHLPTLKPFGSLQSQDAAGAEDLNSRFAYSNVFLLFPDWCNQCVAMGFLATEKAKELLATRHVLFYSLMTQDAPPEKRGKAAIKDVGLPPSKPGKGGGPAPRLHVDEQVAMASTPDARLLGTPTVLLPPATLGVFAATDFPLIIATDHNGIIRDMQVAPEDALAPGGAIDQMAQHIVETWPPD